MGRTIDLRKACEPIDVNVVNQLDLSTIESLLTQIRDSAAAIDANTDQVEAKLDQTILELQNNGTTNNTNLLNVIAELQSIDANTDTLETQLASIISNTSTNATETTLLALLTSTNGIKAQTDLLNFTGAKLRTTGEDASGGGGGANPFGDNSAKSTVALSDVSATVVSADTDRKELIIYNDTGKLIWICYGATAVFGDGFPLEKKEILIEDRYRGVVSAIMDTGQTGNIKVTDVTL